MNGDEYEGARSVIAYGTDEDAIMEVARTHRRDPISLSNDVIVVVNQINY